jgi:hypothetical protein
MGFALPTAGESDASVRVGVERVLYAPLRSALLTAGARDVSMRVGVTK